MKITPLEIRQKNFEKKLRGYDKDEVSAFLMSLSNEWERVLDENKELKIKLDQAEKEVKKLREVESSLFKTLKTAEDTGANLIDQANKAADLHMKETQMNAEALMSEAKSKAKNIIERSEVEARQIIEEMQDAVRELEQNYKSLENHRENIVSELANLSEDLLDRVNRTSKKKSTSFSLEDHTKKVKALVRESEERIGKEAIDLKTPQVPEIKKEELTRPKPTQEEPVSSEQDKPEGSFFDELD